MLAIWIRPDTNEIITYLVLQVWFQAGFRSRGPSLQKQFVTQTARSNRHRLHGETIIQVAIIVVAIMTIILLITNGILLCFFYITNEELLSDAQI